MKKLSICIPTYNRAKELEDCLRSIYVQYGDVDSNDIDIYISDNCSTNGTEEVVRKYIGLGIPIRYSRNEQNIVMFKNFHKCFEAAQGKYIWILSDDDILLPGALKSFFDIVEDKDLGAIYYKCTSTDDLPTNTDSKFQNYHYIVFDDKDEFLLEANFAPTLISALILNKSLMDQISLDRFETSYFPHYFYLLGSLLINPKSIIVEDIFVAATPDNSGGYRWFEAFGNDLIEILDYYRMKGYSRKSIDFVKKELIYWLGGAMFDLKSNSARFKDFNDDSLEEAYKIVFRRYKLSLRFWIYIVPIRYVNITVLKYLRKLHRYVNRLKKMFRNR